MALVLVLALLAQDSLVSVGDPQYLSGTWSGGRIGALRYPTLGLPEIVKAGNTGRAILKLPSAAGAQVTITATGDPSPYSRALAVTGESTDPGAGTTTITFAVPADVPEDTYDIRVVVPGAGVADQQPNAFKVVAAETSSFTFVVIADPQFNDPRGVMSPANRNTGDYNIYTIIQQIKKEIRALNPTFAIMAGDLLFGISYDYEYEGAWNAWKDTGVPIFMVPGNHDGYASTVSRTVMGITSPQRDGLDYWRKFIGPTYFSFDFGGVHFQGVNTYDGTPARRDTFLIVVENYGGDLAQPQMDWIASDLAGRSLVVPFLHHNPLGPYRANQPFSLSWFIITRIIEFLTRGSFDDLGQVWNTQATADFLKAQYAGKAPFLFIGHEHYDDIRPYGGSIYKLVTDAATSGAGYWGYAPVRVQGGAITDYLYRGATEQSVPAGNLHVDVNGGEAIVRSGLARAYGVTIEFLLPEARTYDVTGGTLVRHAAVGGGRSRVWVSATSPVAPSISAPVSTSVSVTPIDPVPQPEAAGRGGNGCGAGGPGNAVALLAALVVLVVVRLRRGT